MQLGQIVTDKDNNFGLIYRNENENYYVYFPYYNDEFLYDRNNFNIISSLDKINCIEFRLFNFHYLYRFLYKEEIKNRKINLTEQDIINLNNYLFETNLSENLLLSIDSTTASNLFTYFDNMDFSNENNLRKALEHYVKFNNLNGLIAILSAFSNSYKYKVPFTFSLLDDLFTYIKSNLVTNQKYIILYKVLYTVFKLNLNNYINKEISSHILSDNKTQLNLFSHHLSIITFLINVSQQNASATYTLNIQTIPFNIKYHSILNYIILSHNYNLISSLISLQDYRSSSYDINEDLKYTNVLFEYGFSIFTDNANSLEIPKVIQDTNPDYLYFRLSELTNTNSICIFNFSYYLIENLGIDLYLTLILYRKLNKEDTNLFNQIQTTTKLDNRSIHFLKRFNKLNTTQQDECVFTGKNSIYIKNNQLKTSNAEIINLLANYNLGYIKLGDLIKEIDTKIINIDYLYDFYKNHINKYENEQLLSFSYSIQKENQNNNELILVAFLKNTTYKYMQISIKGEIKGYFNNLKSKEQYEFTLFSFINGIIENKEVYSDVLKLLSFYFANYYEQNKKNFTNLLKTTLTNYKQTIKTQHSNDKFRLIPFINEINNLNKEEKSQYIIEFKFYSYNNNKSYKIKDLFEFKENVFNELIYTFSQKYSPLLNINNFDSESKNFLQAIKYLNINSTIIRSYDTYNYDKNISSSNLKIKNILSLIFDSYKNSKIIFKNEEYFIQNEKLYPTIHIDKDLKLTIEELSDYEILSKQDNLLINNKEKTIAKLNHNQVINELILNTLESNSPYLSDEILNDFKYSIYLRYPDIFTLDDEIVTKFIYSTPFIQTFIDFNDNKLILNYKLIRERKEIRKEKLTDPTDLEIFDTYLNILSNYGFVDNEITDGDLIYLFLTSDLKELRQISDIYLSDAIKNINVTKFKQPKMTIRYDYNLAEIFMQFSIYSNKTLQKILDSIKTKKKFVLLENNLIYLNNNDAKNFNKVIDDYNIKKAEDLTSHKKLPLYYVFKNSSSENLKFSDELYSVIEDITNFKSTELPLPSNINAVLRPYQQDGVKYLKVLEKYNLSGILADDMGLGKTLQVIVLLEMYKEEKPILIICPTGLLFNWCHEFNKFVNRNINRIYGSKENRIELINSIDNNKKEIFITSYDSLRNDTEFYENKEFGYVILDEGQYIKNSSALKTQSVKKLNSIHRLVLTGTPIENNILDLYSLFDFLMPNYFENINTFKNRYEYDPTFMNEVKLKVAPFILRRTKKEVLTDLPEKSEKIISCIMTDEQRKYYDAFNMKAREIIDNSEDNASIELFSVLTRLRQICISPKLFVDDYVGNSNKLVELEKIVIDRLKNNHKIVIFSQFVKALELIQERFNKLFIKFDCITGDVKSSNRLDICDSFNTSDRIKVLLISLKAGGVGLNLTGADTVIHLDPWWNEQVMNQASDRVYRIGQVNNVEIIKLIMLDSIEMKVLELQEEKRKIINNLISNDDSSITKLTKKDIEFIIKN